MRVGEFHQILQDATNEDGTLQTNGEAIYGSQVFRISKFSLKARLINAIDNLGLMPEAADKATIDLINSHSGDDVFLAEASQHDQIVLLFKLLNPELPVIAKTVKSFSPKQEEQIINIKLPAEISTFKELHEYNKSIEAVFKKFGITSGAKIKGFDVGTEWYQVLIESSPLFKYFVGAAGIAWFAIKTRKMWYESEQTRLTVLSMKDKDKKVDDKSYVDSLINKLINEEATKLVEQLGTPDNREVPETISMVEGGVKAIVEEIDNGSEFHLSLNPPEYLAESKDGRLFKINYSQIPKIEKLEKAKEISAGNKNGK